MEIRKYVDIDQRKINEKEHRQSLIESLISDIKAGTVLLKVENGNLVEVSCTEKINY